MTFAPLNFNNPELNILSDLIIKKAEKLHTSFGNPSDIPYIMESGSYLGNNFYNETIKAFNEIKSSIGSTDQRVKELSEIISVTTVTLARCSCNHANMFAMTSDFKQQPKPVILHTKISVEEAINLIEKVRPFEMSQRARSMLNETSNMSKTALKRLSSTGCYIATCVYQDFNAPQVCLLRQYRDEVLAKNIGGKLFIRLYYFVSPFIVNLLGHNPSFRKISLYVFDKVLHNITRI